MRSVGGGWRISARRGPFHECSNGGRRAAWRRKNPASFPCFQACRRSCVTVLGGRLRLARLPRPKKWSLDFSPGHDPGGVAVAVVGVADARSAAGRSPAGRPRQLRQSGVGTPQQRRHSCFLPELLRPTTRVATSNGEAVWLPLHHLLPLLDRFRRGGGMGCQTHCRRRLPGIVLRRGEDRR